MKKEREEPKLSSFLCCYCPVKDQTPLVHTKVCLLRSRVLLTTLALTSSFLGRKMISVTSPYPTPSLLRILTRDSFSWACSSLKRLSLRDCLITTFCSNTLMFPRQLIRLGSKVCYWGLDLRSRRSLSTSRIQKWKSLFISQSIMNTGSSMVGIIDLH